LQKNSSKSKSRPKTQKNVRMVEQKPAAPYTEVLKEDLVQPGDFEENLAFEERLQALRQTSEAHKKEIDVQNAAKSDVLSSPNYDEPPPLSSTLFPTAGSGEEQTTSSPSEENSFGPSQVALGAVSLALIGVFIIANGGSELGYATKRPTSQTVTSLPEEQKKELELELQKMEANLLEDENDIQSLESAAVINAQLGQFKIASERLEKLVAAKQDDPEALRLLGETYQAQGSLPKAIDTFRSAFAASNRGSLEILTLLTDTMMQSGMEKNAIEEIKSLGGGKSSIGDVELGLLKSKLYAQWRGHISDAFNAYDELISRYPDDFRPQLGKGLLLKQEGRVGDAERYFSQARFLAPPSSRATVDALIKG